MHGREPPVQRSPLVARGEGWRQRLQIAAGVAVSLALHGAAAAWLIATPSGTPPQPSAQPPAAIMVEIVADVGTSPGWPASDDAAAATAAPATPPASETVARTAPQPTETPTATVPPDAAVAAEVHRSPVPTAASGAQDPGGTAPADTATAYPVLKPKPKPKPKPPVPASRLGNDATALRPLAGTHADIEPASGRQMAARDESARPRADDGGGTAVAVTFRGASASLARYVGGGLSNPAPRYPYAAWRRGIEGRVLLRVLVSPAGEAASVAVQATSGHVLLDEAATAAVRNWRFVPAQQDGRPVAGTVAVPVAFRLSD